MSDHPMTFEAWKTQYAHRVMLIASVKRLADALEMLPDDVVLDEQWRAGDLPNECADAEMATWEE
jgi:hypothetical protein